MFQLNTVRERALWYARKLYYGTLALNLVLYDTVYEVSELEYRIQNPVAVLPASAPGGSGWH